MLMGLAERRGQSLTVTVTSGGTFNPDTGSVSGETSTAMSVQCLPSRGKVEAVDGVVLQSGDTVLMIPVQSALTVAPVAGKTVATIDGVGRTAIAMETRRDMGVIAAYVLLMRGAV